MKKVSFILFPFIFAAFSLTGQSYKFPLKVSPNKRYLVDDNGKPFLYNADTGWKLFVKVDDAGVLKYLTDRKKKKFTVIQTMLTGFNEQNLYGVRPFADVNDFSTLNKSYFDRAVTIVQRADSMGLFVAIAPLWAGCCGEGYGGKGAVGPTSIMSTNGPERTRAFGEYIGNLFKHFNNVMWIMGGDIDPFEDKQAMNELALGLKSQAPHQLITYHASSSHSSTDVWDNPSWLDVTMTYTYFRGFNKAWTQDMPDVYEANFKEYKKTPVRPYFLGESTYESEHGSWGSAVQARKQAYWSILTGGAGHAYGTPMWNFPPNWTSYLDLPGGNSFQYMVELFQEYPWYRILPDPDSRIIVSGQGEYAKNDYALAGYDEKAKFIIAYIPSGRIIQVDPSTLKTKKVWAKWFDPGDGKTIMAGRYAKKGILEFKTPDENDWVLVLTGSK